MQSPAPSGGRGIDALADLLADRDSPLDTPSNRRLRSRQPGYAEFGDLKLRSTSPELYAAMSMSMATTDDRLDELATLPMALPVLVLVGEEDRPFIDPSIRMAAATGGALEIIPDAGHSPQFEHPDAWWGALSGFLRSIRT